MEKNKYDHKKIQDEMKKSYEPYLKYEDGTTSPYKESDLQIDEDALVDYEYEPYLKPMVMTKWEYFMTCLPILIILGLIVVSLILLMRG